MIKDPHYWALGIYMIASILLGIIYSNGLILFLGWNLFLAGFLYFLSGIFIYTRKKNHPLIFSILIFALFILFFPNTIYVMTDFIHLEAYDFFVDYPEIYLYNLADWIVFLMITSGALLGANMGIKSLNRMRPYHFIMIKKYYYLYLTLLFIASSIGIYIGRFIRLNSWDLHMIFDVIPDIISRFNFFLGFVLIHVVIHTVSYFVMTSGIKSVYNRIEDKVEE